MALARTTSAFKRLNVSAFTHIYDGPGQVKFTGLYPTVLRVCFGLTFGQVENKGIRVVWRRNSHKQITTS